MLGETHQLLSDLGRAMAEVADFIRRNSDDSRVSGNDDLTSRLARWGETVHTVFASEKREVSRETFTAINELRVKATEFGVRVSAMEAKLDALLLALLKK